MVPTHRFSTSKIGMAPGSVVFTGEQKEEQTLVTVTRYSGPSVDQLENPVADIDELDAPDPDDPRVTWINITGLHDTDLISRLGAKFGVHNLALEDAVHVKARPQLAPYPGHLFASVRMLSNGEDGGIDDEHLALVLGNNWVLSFQERRGDVFGSVRDRLVRGTTRIRSRGADYLWYALLDAVVDHYILVVSDLSTRAEDLERQVWEEEDVQDEVPAMVQEIRRESMTVRRALRPIREMVDDLKRDDPDQITEETHLFLEDLRTHIVELNDSLETIREMLGSLMDAHLTLLSTRANDVMKVLTIVATIFIPITFIAGVYGMNFQHMPELAFPWAYPAALGIMVVTALGMLMFFRRRGWL